MKSEVPWEVILRYANGDVRIHELPAGELPEMLEHDGATFWLGNGRHVFEHLAALRHLRRPLEGSVVLPRYVERP